MLAEKWAAGAEMGPASQLIIPSTEHNILLKTAEACATLPPIP